MRLTRNLGLTLLGVWLVLTGLLPLLTIAIPSEGAIMSVLALVAGLLILLGR